METTEQKPAYKMSLQELQQLRGTICDCDTPSEKAIYWLASAMAHAEVGNRFVDCAGLAQVIAFAAKALQLNKNEFVDRIHDYMSA